MKSQSKLIQSIVWGNIDRSGSLDEHYLDTVTQICQLSLNIYEHMGFRGVRAHQVECEHFFPSITSDIHIIPALPLRNTASLIHSQTKVHGLLKTTKYKDYFKKPKEYRRDVSGIRRASTTAREALVRIEEVLSKKINKQY